MARRKTVYDYFRQAYRRGISDWSPEQAGASGEDGATATFRIEMEAGAARVSRVEYRCTTCVTLVALCEHAAEYAAGRSLEDLRRIDAAAFARMHPEIPATHRDRTELAASALRAALDEAAQSIHREARR